MAQGVNTILVIGGAGYVGSHAAKALAERGFTPVVVDNLSGGHKAAVRWGPIETCDMRDTESLTAIMRKHQANAVLHFAASIEVGIGEREPLAFFDNNVSGTISVLKAMQAADVNKLVFSSTCAVYGSAEPPLDENKPRAPASVYGRTKAIVESLIEDCARAHGLNAVILRYFNASGADASGLIGEQHDPETHLIPIALRAAAGLGARLKVFGNDFPTPDGTCLRDYIHVTDLATAHIAALDLLETQSGVDHFNLGTGQPYSVMEVIERAGKVVGRSVPFDLAPRRQGDVAILTADITKAKTKLGFMPCHSNLNNIVGSAWAFHRKAWGL